MTTPDHRTEAETHLLRSKRGPDQSVQRYHQAAAIAHALLAVVDELARLRRGSERP